MTVPGAPRGVNGSSTDPCRCWAPHSVRGEILGMDLVEELPELLDLVLLLVLVEQDPGLLEDGLVGEDRDRFGIAGRQGEQPHTGILLRIRPSLSFCSQISALVGFGWCYEYGWASSGLTHLSARLLIQLGCKPEPL